MHSSLFNGAFHKMNIRMIFLVLLSVALSSGSQIILKKGMMLPSVQAALSGGDVWKIILTVGLSAPIILGLFCFALSAISWLFVLSRIPLSTAYPFVALGILVTVVAGGVLFGEPITTSKSLGVGSIILGIILVAS